VVLLELSKKRESFSDLAPILWHSTGTVAALLQEIVSIYSLLTPPTLTAHASNRVCNALALLQCVASHADTRQPFLAANMYVIIHKLFMVLADLKKKCMNYSLVCMLPCHVNQTSVPLSISEHAIQIQTIRVPSSYLTRSHWGFGQSG